jgi:hypothetical protein
MKTSTRINRIGILCIIFGTIGMLNSISTILLPSLIEMVKEKAPEHSFEVPIEFVKVAYLELFANIIYIMAGILFLIKKPFSLKMMYLALTISILSKVVPLVYFSMYSSIPFPNYSFNSSNLIRPFIDIVLFIGVIRLSNFYYKSPDELNEMLGGNKIRKPIDARLLKTFTFVSLFCLSIPLSIFGLWNHAISLGSTQADQVAIFHNYFPSYLREHTTFLSICFCVLAIILSSFSMKLPGKLWQGLNIIILLFSSLLLLLNLFWLM